MVQDAATAQAKGVDIVEGFDVTREPFFLDGPVTKRLAVLDFDTQSGDLEPGVSFRPPEKGKKLGRYEIADDADYRAPDFIAVSAFGMVLRTMYMYEEPDNLGRDLVWAFSAPQLLLIPQAGEWANAFYERDSHSLQFFYFTNEAGTLHTALSRDIVAHETAHAILDGIAPSLYHAITPQSLALHEAIADLTALIMAFRSSKLRETVLEQTNGSIRNPTAFASIAEEFGRAIGHEESLRNLVNEKSLDPSSPHAVQRAEPHDLSQVLTGALYSVMVRMHEHLRDRPEAEGQEPRSPSKTLYIAAERFKRMVIRALDYLPSGEISFADYARALIAADQASHPADTKEREWICQEFVRRGIVPDAAALEVATNFEHEALRDTDVATLAESDWAAYAFANANRDLLGIPPNISFRVWPRLDVTKRYYHRGGQVLVRECILKVSWDQEEPNPLGGGLPSRRVITVGSTIAIDWESRRVRALLVAGANETTDGALPRGIQEAERDQQAADRTAMLQRLLEREILRLDHAAVGPDGRPLRSVVEAQTLGDVMRVRGAAKMLHLAVGV